MSDGLAGVVGEIGEEMTKAAGGAIELAGLAETPAMFEKKLGAVSGRELFFGDSIEGEGRFFRSIVLVETFTLVEASGVQEVVTRELCRVEFEEAFDALGEIGSPEEVVALQAFEGGLESDAGFGKRAINISECGAGI
jgi:hypothetical protein